VPGGDSSLNTRAVILLSGGLDSATVLAMGYIVYGGVRMILSRGNEEGVKVGKETMKNAIYGLIIVLLAYLLVGSVVSYFTGLSFQDMLKFISK
jgi:hypothetical protein